MKNGRECVSEGCKNAPHPDDWRGLCLTCNPFGDSAGMNNTLEYQSRLSRADY